MGLDRLISENTNMTITFSDIGIKITTTGPLYGILMDHPAILGYSTGALLIATGINLAARLEEWTYKTYIKNK